MKNNNKQQKYSPDLKAKVDSLLLDRPCGTEGHMFGYPAYYVNKKLAICHYGEGIALKLPAEEATALKESDPACNAFCPMGKSMGRHWVILYPENSNKILEYAQVLRASVSYLKKVTESGKIR